MFIVKGIFLFTMFKSIACYVVRGTIGARGKGAILPLGKFSRGRTGSRPGIESDHVADTLAGGAGGIDIF